MQQLLLGAISKTAKKHYIFFARWVFGVCIFSFFLLYIYKYRKGREKIVNLFLLLFWWRWWLQLGAPTLFECLKKRRLFSSGFVFCVRCGLSKCCCFSSDSDSVQFFFIWFHLRKELFWKLLVAVISSYLLILFRFLIISPEFKRKEKRFIPVDLLNCFSGCFSP